MEGVCKIGNVEEAIYEMEIDSVADDIVETEDGCQLVISGWWVHIPELGINLHEGIFCRYDEKEKEYLPDFSVTVIREEGQEEWLYYEQDGFAITLANWLNGKENVSNLEQMQCFICIPNE